MDQWDGGSELESISRKYSRTNKVLIAVHLPPRTHSDRSEGTRENRIY